MKLFAQHGFGPGDKIVGASNEHILDGVIYSARYASSDHLSSEITEIQRSRADSEIMLDPEFYASLVAGTPNAHLGRLEEWSYFKPSRRNELESADAVRTVLESAFQAVAALPLTSVIAPNIYISRSFDSIEALIAKNFIRLTRSVHEHSYDKRAVYATLAVNREAFMNPQEFISFVNDLTVMDRPPDGFYVLVGGGLNDERTDVSGSEIINAHVIGGWMFLNHVLNVNGFRVINGCSDILAPLLLAAGGDAGASGWWTNLRMFSMSRYVRTATGGRQPQVRYLSRALFDRVVHSELEAFSALLPQVMNSLPHDVDYQAEGVPTKTEEALQNWEALRQMIQLFCSRDVAGNLVQLGTALSEAEQHWTALSAMGLSVNVEGRSEYLGALRDAIDVF